MLKWSHSILATILLIMLSASLSAQNQPKSPAADKLVTRQVIASVSDNSIRFTSLGELIQMRLEVIGLSGETLVDSDFKPDNVIDWPGLDSKGKRLADGAYLCIVSVRDSSGQLTRKQAIVILREGIVSMTRPDASTLSAAQAQAAGPATDEDVSVTILEPQQSSATAILAHDGNTAQLVSGSGGLSISSGDFFSNKLLEHIRLTAEGNVGIGVPNPRAKLDVAGTIRAGQGIVFPDGSIQYSAATKTYGAKSSLPDPLFQSFQSKSGKKSSGGQKHIDAAGTGTQNFIAKWAETGGTGTLQNSGIFETAGGDVGIGITNPIVKLDVSGALNIGGSNLYLGGFLRFTDNANAGYTNFVALNGNLTNFDGVNYEQLNLYNPGGDKAIHLAQTAAGSQIASIGAGNTTLALQPSGGNVGIGTTTPAKHLHIFGPGDQELAIESSDASGRRWTLQSSRGTNNGRFEIIDRTANTNRFAILDNGNVGIGTTAPGALLDVQREGTTAETARFTTYGGSNDILGRASGGTRAAPTATTNGHALLQLGATGHAGGTDFVSNPKATIRMTASETWTSTANGTNIRFNTTANGTTTTSTKMIITDDGSVGIGTATPDKHLHILGAGDQEIGIESSDNGGALWTLQSSRGANNGRFEIVNRTAGLSRFTITAFGDVGVGTTTPVSKLHVSADVQDSDGIPAPGEHVALIENTQFGDAQSVLALRINRLTATEPNHTNNYITFFKKDNSTAGAIQGNGFGGVELAGPGSDYAEWMPRLNPAEQIRPGEIVGLLAGRITKNTRGAKQVMAVSTGPIVAGNDPGSEARGGYERVAFIGQVMVRVRGAVQAGDFIVASGLNDGTGVAVSPECIASEQFEQVVGQAWESSSDTGVKSVRTAVGLIHRDPTVKSLLESTRRQAAQIAALDARLAAVELQLKKKPALRKAVGKR